MDTKIATAVFNFDFNFDLGGTLLSVESIIVMIL